MRYILVLMMVFWGICAEAAELKIADKVTYQVKVARTRDELTRGLMFVREMPADSGMIFDFRPYQDRELSMWMKNTYIPLDMIFIDCAMKVVDFYENAKPFSLDEIRSKEKFCYVLEVNGGSVKKNKIAVGDEVIYTDSK